VAPADLDRATASSVRVLSLALRSLFFRGRPSQTTKNRRRVNFAASVSESDGRYAIQAWLCQAAHTQGHGAGSNWLVFLKAHPWGSMTQCQFNFTGYYM
jgi:hypothetical protein